MKNILYIAFIGIVIFGCKKKKFVIHNLNGNKIEIMGHGGMGISSLYPINTAESILRCINEGADGTEIDVQLTADNQLVAYHNGPMTDNTNFTGRIRDHSWTQLKEARYTSTPQLNYKILNLTEFFSTIGNLDSYTFTLDIKLYRGDEEFEDYVDDFTDAIDDLYDQFSIKNTVFVESQSDDFITELQAKDADILQYIYAQNFEEGYSLALDLGLRGISINNKLITREQVDLAHTHGIFITIWGVNSRGDNMDAIRKNPDMIQTDKIDHLVKYFAGS